MRPGESNHEVVGLVPTLQRMWPHREHESGALRALMCLLGLHLWLQPDYSSITNKRAVRFCMWCSCVEIDGQVYR
jgi:hypothetical protein